MHMCDLFVQYARTILMMRFASRALNAVPRVRAQSEAYFGFKTTAFVQCMSKNKHRLIFGSIR